MCHATQELYAQRLPLVSKSIRESSTEIRCALAVVCPGIPKGNHIPVYHIPPRSQVVWPTVLVVEVVGVLPNIDAEYRGQALHIRAVLIGRGKTGKVTTSVHT